MKTPTTLAEANKLQLEVTFLTSAAAAETHALVLAERGHNVVAVFEETLEHATKPLFLVCETRFKAPGRTNAHKSEKL